MTRESVGEHETTGDVDGRSSSFRFSSTRRALVPWRARSLRALPSALLDLPDAAAADGSVGDVVGRAGERVSFTLRCAGGAE